MFSKSFLNPLENSAMKSYLITALIAIAAVAVAKRVPVVRDYL